MHRLLPIAGLLALGFACTGVDSDDSAWGGDTGLDGPKDANALPDTDEETGAPVGDLTNNAPNAYAGPDQTSGVLPGDTVIVDGSSSTDLDADPLTFLWEILAKPVGSAANMADFQQAQASLWVDRSGEYQLRLTVTDARGLSDTDDLKITVENDNQAPVADAGGDRTVDVLTFVQLDGTGSSDPDDDPLTWHWSLMPPPGSGARLEGNSIPEAAQSPYFTPDVAGTYRVELKVNDGQLDSQIARVFITARSVQTGNGGIGSSSSSSSSGDCLDCAASSTAVASATWTAGDVASSFGLILLPVFVTLWHRRRED